MTLGLIFKLMLCVVIVVMGVGVYRNENGINKKYKPYSLREIYTIGGYVNEGIFLESKVNYNVRLRHIETLDLLIAKSYPESIERQKLQELRHAIAIENYDTQIEQNATYYQSKICELQDKNEVLKSKNKLQKDELIRLKNEIRKLRSYQKRNRRL